VNSEEQKIINSINKDSSLRRKGLEMIEKWKEILDKEEERKNEKQSSI
jgi:hypothetical protein